jgi:hypothetical protein
MDTTKLRARLAAVSPLNTTSGSGNNEATTLRYAADLARICGVSYVVAYNTMAWELSTEIFLSLVVGVGTGVTFFGMVILSSAAMMTYPLSIVAAVLTMIGGSVVGHAMFGWLTYDMGKAVGANACYTPEDRARALVDEPAEQARRDFYYVNHSRFVTMFSRVYCGIWLIKGTNDVHRAHTALLSKMPDALTGLSPDEQAWTVVYYMFLEEIRKG